MAILNLHIKYKIIFLLIWVTLISNKVIPQKSLSITGDDVLTSQQFPVYHFGIENGLPISNIADIKIDAYSIPHIIHFSGISRIIGKEIVDINHSNFNNIDGYSKLDFNEKNQLTYSNYLGFKTIDQAGQVIDSISFNQTEYIILGKIDAGYLCYSLDKGVILLNKNREEKILLDKKINFSSHDFYTINYKTLILSVNEGIYRISQDEENLFIPYKGSKQSGILKNKNEYVFFEDKKIKSLDFSTGKVSEKGKIPGNITSDIIGKRIHWKDDIWLITSQDKVYAFDIKKYTFLYEIKNLLGESLTKGGNITLIDIDDYENIYLGTIKDGIFKIPLSLKAIKYYSTGSPEDTFSKNVYKTKSGKIITINFYSQVSIFDQSLKLTHRFKPIPNETNRLVSFSEISENKYLALYSDYSNYLIVTIKGDNYEVERKSIPQKINQAYYSKELSNDNEFIYLLIEDYLVKYHKIRQKIDVVRAAPNSIMVGLKKNDSIITMKNATCFIFDNNLQLKDSLTIDYDNFRRDIINFENNQYLIACNDGLYKFDLVRNIYEKYSEIEECVYSVRGDSKQLFASTPNGIVVLKDGKIIDKVAQLDYYTINEFNTNASIQYGNEIYFGGSAGIVQLDSEFEYGKLNETRVYEISTEKRNVSVYHEKNNTFEVLPSERAVKITLYNIGQESSNNLNYQYFIDKKSDNWIDLESNNSFYLSLRPGLHKIYYTSSTSYDKDAIKEDFIILNIKTYWYNSLWFKTLLFLVFLGILFYAFHSYRKLQFNKKIKELEFNQLLNSEKQTISRDLHDNIGIQMSLIKRNLDFIHEHFFSLKSEKIRSKVKKLSDTATLANTALRDAIWAYKKQAFSIGEIIDRLYSLQHKMNEGLKDDRKIIISNNLNDSSTILPPTKALNLYRIIQEALHNVLKHSEATETIVTINESLEAYTFEIKDNGKGFDIEKVELGNGINNMKERAKESEIDIIFQSIIDKYSLIRLHLKK